MSGGKFYPESRAISNRDVNTAQHTQEMLAVASEASCALECSKTLAHPSEINVNAFICN